MISLSTRLAQALAPLTRRFHPRGTARILRLLHSPAGAADALESLVKLDHNIEVSANTLSDVEWPLYFFGGRGFEPWLADLIVRYCRPGTVAIDVGANVGVHTLRMSAAVGGEGLVLAFEPDSDVRHRLRANLERNGRTNVTIRPEAVGETNGPAVLYVPNKEPGYQAYASIRHNERYLSSARATNVEIGTLDSLAGDLIDRVSFMKIDVEGHEPAVIRGAKSILAKSQPCLAFEYDREWWASGGDNLDAVLAFLVESGYESILVQSGTRLAPLIGRCPDRANIVAMPKNR